MLSLTRSTLVALLLASAPFSAFAAEPKQTKTYYDSNNAAKNYEETWGKGNIHFPYFPDMSKVELHDFASIDQTTAKQRYSAGAERLSQEIAIQGKMGPSSAVLDLGCGYGKPLADIVKFSKAAKGVGLDLATRHVAEGNKNAQADPEIKDRVSYVEGSYLDLPKELENKFTHVTSNVAFCHMQSHLLDILKNAYKALKPGGVISAVDYLKNTNHEPDEITKEFVYKRLTFTKLVSHADYKKALVDAGFEIEYYHQLDEHMCYGYALLAAASANKDLRSADGRPLSQDYTMTVKSCHEFKDIGMNLYVARKPLSAKAEL